MRGTFIPRGRICDVIGHAHHASGAGRDEQARQLLQDGLLIGSGLHGLRLHVSVADVHRTGLLRRATFLLHRLLRDLWE